MPINKWLERISEIVQEAKNNGRDFLSYEEVSVKLNVTPNYARELLKLYSISYGLKYERGRLFLGTENDESSNV